MWIVEDEISAIHQIDWVDKNNPEHQPHGHNFRVFIRIEGDNEWMDRFSLTNWVKEATSIYKYKDLSEYNIRGLEDFAYSIRNRVQSVLRQHLQRDYLVNVTIYETSDYGFETK